MGYVTDRQARLQKQLTSVQASLDALYSIRTEMAATGAKSYKFDSGEGSQSTTRRDLSEILESISQLEATESHLINEIYGMGIIAVKVRRKVPNL